MLFRRINHTRIERPRINVQADCALIKLARVVHAMYWLLRIDGAGTSRVHLHSISCFEITRAGFELLRHHTIILDQ
jgi:hypothetical protein